MNIKQYLAKLDNDLSKSYPDGIIPDKLAGIINCEIARDQTYENKKDHTTIQLQDNYQRMINIDSNIAELVFCIWMANIDTISSCENDFPQDYIWIQFNHKKDLMKFLKILFVGIDSNHYIYQRAICNTRYDPNAWIYDIHLDGTSEYSSNSDSNEADLSKIEYITYSVSVRFPRIDYQWILDRISNHLTQN